MERGVVEEGVVLVEELTERFRLRRLGGGALSGVLLQLSELPVILVSGSRLAVVLVEEESGDASARSGNE